MLRNKKEHPPEKAGLHPRNRHRERYDFGLLTAGCPELARFVKVNEYGDESVDFFDPGAVKMLNKALLKHYYGIDNWDIPSNYLCPPVPGRADYIHHVADLLRDSNRDSRAPTGNRITCLDIGVGANCVYPIIGNKEYGWSFVGTDIDRVAIESATNIVKHNAALEGKVELRLQPDPRDIFNGVIKKGELFDLSICNPPFHASLAEARSGTVRKLGNLTHKKIGKPVLNFGGQNNELWCDGGEGRFARDMISQSTLFRASCFWFTTLISKESNLRSVCEALKKARALDTRTLPMSHGNKTSRIVAWTFLTREEQVQWMNARWKETPRQGFRF